MNLAEVRDRPDHVPLIWSNGVGVNSVAVATLMVEWGLKPQLNLMADTGDEHEATYEYVAVLDEFLTKHGLPKTQVVRKRSKYGSLYQNCLNTDTLPSKAYGGSSCSEKWKVTPQNYICRRWQPALDCWDRGDKVVKIIGYDYGDRDQTRYALSAKAAAKDTRYSYWYPLREAKLDREACKAVIRNAGLPVPRKSACWHCPASKWAEVRQLAAERPDLMERAVTLEVNAAQGKHGLKSTRGLGRRWSWLARLADTSPGFAEKYREELEVYESHMGVTTS